MTNPYLRSNTPPSPGSIPIYRQLRCKSCFGSTEHRLDGYEQGTTKPRYRCTISNTLFEGTLPALPSHAEQHATTRGEPPAEPLCRHCGRARDDRHVVVHGYGGNHCVDDAGQLTGTQYEPADTRARDADACDCGSDNFEITATLIRCRACGRLWGRVNDAWVLDPDSVPAAPSPAASEPSDAVQAARALAQSIPEQHAPDCAWREQGRAPAGTCPFCASRISVIERDGVFVARCSHRGCGARGPKHHDITRACDLFCCPPPRTAGGMGGPDTVTLDRISELEAKSEPRDDAATDALDAIAVICECQSWDYPGQLVRDVANMKARLFEVRRENEALKARVAELDRDLDIILNQRRDESDRIDRWHDTFNAALTGLCACIGRVGDGRTRPIEIADALDGARQVADDRHGPLPAPDSARVGGNQP
jgi:hypothetical protein